jgi:hypothetical protein
VFAGAGEASADVPGGGESDGVIEDIRDKLANTRMNGEEIELDGERGNRPVCNLLFVCENFHCLNAFFFFGSCRIECIGVVTSNVYYRVAS